MAISLKLTVDHITFSISDTLREIPSSPEVNVSEPILITEADSQYAEILETIAHLKEHLEDVLQSVSNTLPEKTTEDQELLLVEEFFLGKVVQAVSIKTIELDWKIAKAWLKKNMSR